MRYRQLCVWMVMALLAVPVSAQEAKPADPAKLVGPPAEAVDTAKLAKDLADLSASVSELLKRSAPAVNTPEQSDKAVVAFRQAWSANLASTPAQVCKRAGGDVVIEIKDNAVNTSCMIRNHPKRHFLFF